MIPKTLKDLYEKHVKDKTEDPSAKEELLAAREEEQNKKTLLTIPCIFRRDK